MKTCHAVSNPVCLGLLALLVVGCASQPKGPSFEVPADLTAPTQESLASLFDQISLQAETAEAGSERALQLAAQKRTVGDELANRSAASVRKRLSEAERVEGHVPMGALERELAGLGPIERWSPDIHAQISGEVQGEIDGTRAKIAAQEEKLAVETDPVERLRILSALSSLSGSGSAEQARYAEQLDALLLEIAAQADEAILNEDFEKAQSLLGAVQEVQPAQADERKICEVDAQVLLKRFSQTLESGKVGGSTQMLQELSEKECFAEIREGLAGSAAPMVEAFAMLGQEAASAGNLGEAYQRFRDAQQLQLLLLGEKGTPAGMDAFLRRVEKAYEKTFAAGEHGLAWGYLNVLTDFAPTTPKNRQRVRKTREEVAQRAVRGVTTYPFADSPNSAAQVGDAVASKVVQHIFSTIPTDVRIVERDQLERILGECERAGNCKDLDTADFMIQGSILDAKVETTEKSGVETKRVVTGNEAVVNPDHTRWSQLGDRDRERTPEPQRTVSRDVTEDITIAVTNVRKVGIISVSYRVVEANSGRVLFTDSLQTKQEFQDEGRQGIELGNFKQETDFVELLPDIEILSGTGGLADKISEEIGGKLVEFLRDPENHYVEESARFADEGDYAAAARTAAYALVLTENKSKEVGDLRANLMRYAMSSPGV